MVLQKHLKKLGKTPQHCLYSATYNDDIITKTKQFVGAFEAFTCPKESLKLKGVRNLKLYMEEG